MEIPDRAMARRAGRAATEPAALAGWLSGKLMLIRSVTSGRDRATRPPNPTEATRLPAGLVSRTLRGAAPTPLSGVKTSSPIRRLPCQLSWITGCGPAAIQGPALPPRSRLAAAKLGSEPSVLVELTRMLPRPARASRSRTAVSARPGRATAVAVIASRREPAMANVRASGGYAAALTSRAGDGSCCWKEKACPDLPGPDLPGPDLPGPDWPRPDWPRPDSPRPDSLWAGFRKLCTRTPGIRTSRIPAPSAPPGRPRVIVMRSHVVGPGAARSD